MFKPYCVRLTQKSRRPVTTGLAAGEIYFFQKNNIFFEKSIDKYAVTWYTNKVVADRDKPKRDMKLNTEGFPSGQRGQTVNLLLLASMVRIHLPPPNSKKCRLYGTFCCLYTIFTRFYLKSRRLFLLHAGKDVNMCSTSFRYLHDLNAAQSLVY